ncbi:hypothetical protein HY504_00495 [Candidatus Wolfebacteria bacterium]|nr:hypothetical protein [Candidatus Wolfebacteria bacterium]
MPKKKKLSIEQRIEALARMTQRGFTDLDKKIGDRLDSVEGLVRQARREMVNK